MSSAEPVAATPVAVPPGNEDETAAPRMATTAWPWRSAALVAAVAATMCLGYGIGLAAATDSPSHRSGGKGGGIFLTVFAGLLAIAAIAAAGFNVRLTIAVCNSDDDDDNNNITTEEAPHNHPRLPPPHWWWLWVPGGLSWRGAAVAIPTLVVTTVTYLIGIGVLDNYAGNGKTYASVEYVTEPDKFAAVVAGWDPAGRASMAASSGLHVFAAFSYSLLLCVWLLRVATVAAARRRAVVTALSNVLSAACVPMAVAYVCAHCSLLCLLVSRRTHPDQVLLIAATVFEIVFLVLLVPGVVVALVCSALLACRIGERH